MTDLLARIFTAHGPQDILISAVSVIEIEHGLWRANTPQLTRQRRQYIDEIYQAIPVRPFTKEMGEMAAKVDAEARKIGEVIPFADLQIGITALYLGYAILTGNPRHFSMIPNLGVKQL